jgi:hypothetical protein
MERGHFAISKLLVSQVLVVLVLAPFVWGRSYGVQANGTATSCGGTKQYDMPGKFSAKGAKQTSCAHGSAMASSQAYLENGSTTGTLTLDSYKSQSSGIAESITYDLVTLYPPEGYNEDSVSFTVEDDYDISIENSGSSGYVKLCWTAAKLWKQGQCIRRIKNSQGDVNWGAKLTKSSSGFKFAIELTAFAAASVSGTGTWTGLYDTQGEPNFDFAQSGWTCTFASGAPCETLGRPSSANSGEQSNR